MPPATERTSVATVNKSSDDGERAAMVMAIAMASGIWRGKSFHHFISPGSLAFQTPNGILVPTSETVGIVVLCSKIQLHGSVLQMPYTTI